MFFSVMKNLGSRCSEIRILIINYDHIGISPSLIATIYRIQKVTCSITRRPLRSHTMVYSKNHLFIVGIVPICDKEL